MQQKFINKKYPAEEPIESLTPDSSETAGKAPFTFSQDNRNALRFLSHEVKGASKVMFKQPETFRASAPGKFLMLAGATAAREGACHCVRATSTGREQVWDSVPGPL